MKYDNDFLKTLYENNTLEDFISLVEPSNIADPRTRAIISGLKRSVRVLELDFTPIPLFKPNKNIKSHNKQG